MIRHFTSVPRRLLLSRAVVARQVVPVLQRQQNVFITAFSTSTNDKVETPTSSPSPDSDATKVTSAKPTAEMEFQAETRQLLDIVTNSLYTDKEVFLRELISNASDALEKLRHLQTVNKIENLDKDVPLEIRIDTDESNDTITITDTGVGMTQDEMISNLGTIARSGSKLFQQQELEKDPSKGIIGRFGVGFYSAFMISDKVEVRSQSAINSSEPPKVWTSSGQGSFTIGELSNDVRQLRGSSIVMHIKPDHKRFCDEHLVETILKRYSNFINFPIYLNGKRVNTIQAVWAQDPKEVKKEDYVDFYKYIANAIDHPFDTYHFRADAPLDVKALFFIPSFHSEKYGMDRMEPGVSLYSRKVLIENKSPDILPDWLRFIKGVVDSEDLPLSISREKAQDSALVAKLRSVLTRKIIAHLQKILKNDRERYTREFYNEYSFFLKEGICQDYEFQAQLSKLLFFYTSKSTMYDIVSLDEYISRMRPEQNEIYYLVAPSQDAAEASPYLEAFKKANVEVLFLFSAVDDFVMANLGKYEGRKLLSIDRSDIDLSKLMDAAKDEKDENKTDYDELYESDRTLTDEEQRTFCAWFQTELGEGRVKSCATTNRLSTSPAIITDNESGAMRRMMRLVDTSTNGNRDSMPLPSQNIQINPNHPVILGISDLIDKEPMLAKVLAEQVFDNCLVSAGLMEDSRSMLPRLNDILMCVVNGAKAQPEKSAEILKGKKSKSAKSKSASKETETDSSTSKMNDTDTTNSSSQTAEATSTKTKESVEPEVLEGK